jgi:hypothetical protein
VQDGVCRGHGDVRDEVHILSIVEVRSFDLEQVEGVPDHQLMMVEFGLPSGCKEVKQPQAVQEIDGQMAKVSHLQPLCQLLQLKPELHRCMIQGPVLDPGVLRSFYGVDHFLEDGLHLIHSVKGYLLDLQ